MPQSPKLRFSLTPVPLLVFAVLTGVSLTFEASRSSAKAPEANWTSDAGTSAIDRSAKVASAYGGLPLTFEANMGQADKRVRFIARGAGYGLFLTSDGALLALRPPMGSSNEWPSRAA
jgi:hypothetical protein